MFPGLVVAGAAAGSPPSEGPAPREAPSFLGPIGQQREVEFVRTLERKSPDPAAGTRAVLLKYPNEAPDIEVAVHGSLKPSRGGGRARRRGEWTCTSGSSIGG